MMSNNKSSISFPTVFSKVNGATKLLSGTDSINNSLKLLLLTRKGELYGDPYYGCSLQDLIYDLDDDSIADEISQSIVECISLYETRVIVNSNDISISITDRDISILINYTVISTNESEELSLVLLRGGIQ